MQTKAMAPSWQRAAAGINVPTRKRVKEALSISPTPMANSRWRMARSRIQTFNNVTTTTQRPLRSSFQSFDGVSFELVFVADGRSARPMLKGENRFQFVPTPVTSTSFIHMRMDTRMKSSCSRSSNARDILDSRSRRLHDAYDIDPQGPRTMKSR
jgi:hypothetical protein